MRFARATVALHIPDVLTPESAKQVHRCLAQETEFATVSRDGDGYVRVGPGVNPEQEAEMMTKAYHAARDGFHYLYDNHPMSHEARPIPIRRILWPPSRGFLNSAPVLDFARLRHRFSRKSLLPKRRPRAIAPTISSTCAATAMADTKGWRPIC